MNRTPAALVVLLGLSGTRTVGAEPCAPRAQLEGDREAIERVSAELAKLGVAIAPATEMCPSLQARVELDTSGGIAVAVHAAAQRSEGRVVSDAVLAAAWIDSWVRDDLDVARWPGPTTVAAPTVASIVPPSAIVPRDVPAPAAVPATPLLARVTLGAAYELAETSDGSSFTGFGASACVHVDSVCIGGRVRASFEPQLTSGLTAAARSDLSVLATASVPVSVGEMIVAPEAGLGIGRFSTRRLDGCEPVTNTPPACNPMTDPNCLMDPATDMDVTCQPGPNGSVPNTGTLYVGDNFDQATYTPRLSIALRVAIPLVKYVLLDGFAGIELMPFGHGDPFVPALMPPGMFTPDDAKLPGEPWHSARVGIGIRIGAP